MLNARQLIRKDQLNIYDEKIRQSLPKQRQQKPTTKNNQPSAKPQQQSTGSQSGGSSTTAANTSPPSKVPVQPAKKTETATSITVEVEPEKHSTREEKPKDAEAIKQNIQTQASKVLKIKDELKGLERRVKQVSSYKRGVVFVYYNYVGMPLSSLV